MRKTFLILIFVLVGALPVLAQEDTPGDPIPAEPITGIVVGDNLFVYTGPDYAYRFIGQLPRNASLVIVGKRIGGYYSERWLEIEYGDRTAWVFARYVRTSIAYENIPTTGRPLPRDRNGEVPEGFSLDTDICDTWPADGFSVSGDFSDELQTITFNFPALPGANAYSVFTYSPLGYETRFSGTETSITVELKRLPTDPGTFRWTVVPYWTYSESRWSWQTLCPARTGGTFERPPLDEGN